MYILYAGNIISVLFAGIIAYRYLNSKPVRYAYLSVEPWSTIRYITYMTYNIHFDYLFYISFFNELSNNKKVDI